VTAALNDHSKTTTLRCNCSKLVHSKHLHSNNGLVDRCTSQHSVGVYCPLVSCETIVIRNALRSL
jgi:hypothetical protein